MCSKMAVKSQQHGRIKRHDNISKKIYLWKVEGIISMQFVDTSLAMFAVDLN